MSRDIRADRQRVARAANEDFMLVTAHDAILTLVCECGSTECDATLYLERRVFDGVRRQPTLFVTTTAHADPGRAVEIRHECAVVSGWDEAPAWPDDLPPPDRARLRRFRRHANELVGSDGGTRLILCECGRRACTALIQVAPHELGELRSEAGWYVVSPGHQMDGDRVVRSGHRFLIVASGSGELERTATPAG